MSGQDNVYRTSSGRVVRMMAIMLGICIVGGVIFFGMWDYWISMPPNAASSGSADSHDTAAATEKTGVSHSFELDFVESSDFRVLAFNALPGEDGNNPTITVDSGDEITITATNAGVSFHAFGVVSDPSDFGNVLWGSAIAAPTNPLKSGESDTTTFVAGEAGEYYYICTVPGHAAQGMQGSFIVE